MTALSPGPAPGLVNDWLSWQLVAVVVLTFCVYGAIWVTREILRIGAKWDADRPALLDDEPDVPYHCAVHGHYYQAHGTVWLCATCGYRRPRNAIRWCDEDVFDQDGVA